VNTSRSRTLLATPVLLAALLGLAACGGTENPLDQNSTSHEMLTPTSPAEGTTAAAPLALVADGSTAGKCAVPSAETLGTADTAFEGTVASIADGVVTLQVDQWFSGASEPATVTVQAPSQAMKDLLMAVDFQQGKTYLVSAQGNRVSLCGFSGEKTQDLESLYSQAFSL
jgi:hypothetical protein